VGGWGRVALSKVRAYMSDLSKTRTAGSNPDRSIDVFPRLFFYGVMFCVR